MSNLITVQDIISQAKDYVQNYTTGTTDLGNTMRALNRAFEYVQRRLSLPSDEQISTFYFSQDQYFYNLPTGFNEPLQLLYHNTDHNIPGTEWTYLPYPEILRNTGGIFRNNVFSFTAINGVMQLVMFGANLNQGATLATFDSTTGFTAQNNAQNFTSDTNIKKEGTASLKFDINPNLTGTGKASIYFPVSWDVRVAHTNNGKYKLWLYLPSVNFTSINLVFGSSATDYYTFTATATDAGTTINANAANNWYLFSWGFADSPVIVGSPNDALINFARIDLVQNGSFGATTVTGFRADDLYSVAPDQMDLIYQTAYKGTDSTGATKKIFFTDPSDVPTFGNMIPDLLNPIALRMAYILAPQLKKDATFMGMYKNDCEEVLKYFSRSYPRKRIITSGRTTIQRQ